MMRRSLSSVATTASAAIASPSAKKPRSALEALASVDVHQSPIGGERVVLEGYYSDGFSVVGRDRLAGPLVVLPKTVLKWNVRTWADVTPTALALFEAPRTTLLLLGTGATHRFLPAETVAWLRGRGVAVECMATDKAVATFNILNEEHRQVAAALLTMEETAWAQWD